MSYLNKISNETKHLNEIMKEQNNTKALLHLADDYMVDGNFDSAAYTLSTASSTVDLQQDLVQNSRFFKQFCELAEVYSQMLGELDKAAECHRRAMEVYDTFRGTVDRKYMIDLVRYVSQMVVVAEEAGLQQEAAQYMEQEKNFRAQLLRCEANMMAEEICNSSRIIIGVLQHSGSVDRVQKIYDDMQFQYEMMRARFPEEEYGEIYRQYQLKQNTSVAGAAWNLCKTCENGREMK